MNLPVNQIIQGDCLEVMKQWPDKCVDVVITDPPYGIDIQKTGSGVTGRRGFIYGGDFTQNKAAVIAGDKSPDGRWLVEAFRLLKDDSAMYMFSRWDVDAYWVAAMESAGFRIKNQIIWAKHTGGSGDLDAAFMPSHETLWLANKGRRKLNGKRLKDVWFDNWTECIRHSKCHPFEKPVDILQTCLEQHSNNGDLILDPFCGSGTTCVAAELLGRKWIGIELDPKYCDIARKRVKEAQEQFALLEMK
jgi:site-specific DNA-methyltransferase (adenine-specific)